MMSMRHKAVLNFPDFKLTIASNDRNIRDLILRQFPHGKGSLTKGTPSARKLNISIRYHRTQYSKLPRSRKDCFRQYALFYNNFQEERYINFDAGPRTLKVIINPKTKMINCYVATPYDFEQNLLFDLIFFQPLKWLLQLHRLYIFHSSCVAQGKKGILFSGESESGKSTLALALSKSGYDYLADEKVILQKNRSGIMCTPFISRPKLKERSLSYFPELKGKIIRGCLKKEKQLINHDALLLNRKKDRVKPRLLIFPRYIKTAKTRLEPMNKQDALSQLASEERYFSKEYFLISAHLLRQVDTYQLHYRDEDLSQVPELINAILKGE